MSYRSKRTRAHMINDDDWATMKKVMSSTTTSLPENVNVVTGNRWGPFSPLCDKTSENHSTKKVALQKPNVVLQPTKSKLLSDPQLDSQSISKKLAHKHHTYKEAQRTYSHKLPLPNTHESIKNTKTPQPQQASQVEPPSQKFPILKIPTPLKNVDTPKPPESAPIWKNPPSAEQNHSLGECRKSIELDNKNNNKNKNNNNNIKDVEKLPVASQEKVSDVGNGQQNGFNGTKSFKPVRRTTRSRDWPDDVQFDEKEEVLAIDAEGKYQMISDPVQPPDVWHSNGVKYFVSFNEFHQPLRKGGHILVRFIGDVAKTERFCPIRETNWHHVNTQYKADVIKLIRAHFIIPEGDCYDQGILKRTGKSVRQYRHSLKKALFKPTQKTKDQIYEAGPEGHPRDSWIHLVDYWYSEKGKQFSKCGKEARLSQNHVHTTGSQSYANIRADFEEKNAREPSALEFFEHTHRKKDGTFVKDTMTEDFLIDVDANVYTEMAFNPDSAKSRIEIENEAFNKLMYGGEVPKRPVGYGYGVKQSDVFGVRGILRKEGFHPSATKNIAFQNMENAITNLREENKSLVQQNEELQTKYDENNCLLKKMTTQFGQILDVLSTGKAPPEFLDLAKTVINPSNSKV